MELVEPDKNSSEISGGLRLVADNKEPHKFPVIQKQFVNFAFFAVRSDWRRLEEARKVEMRAEFEAVYKGYQADILLYSYSMIGLDAKADFMLWRIGPSLDQFQEMSANLLRTSLGSYLDITSNYLSVTKRRMFISEQDRSVEDRYHIVAGEKKYHFVYPVAKSRDWYEKTGEERDSLIEDSFMVGKKFRNINIHMTHTFGFAEQEYIVSFETDEPRDFLALAEELKETPSSKFTVRGAPIYTCRQKSLQECLEAIG